MSVRQKKKTHRDIGCEFKRYNYTPILPEQVQKINMLTVTADITDDAITV